MRQILCLLALAFAATAVTTSFTATVTVTDDPSVWGVMTGTMTYKYASSATLKSTVWTLSDKTTVTEFINYTATTRYLYCSSCQAETYKNTPEQFYPLSSDVLLSSTADSKGCYKYNRSDGSSVRYVYWTGKTYSTATFCAAVYTDGKRIDFTDIVAATSPTFPNTVTWGCPAKTCNVVMDLVLVIDESTSIDTDEWANSVDFATTLVSKFNVSSSAVNVGLVYFASDSRIVSYLDGSATNVKNTLTSTYQRGGNTCMGCGVSSAIAVFKARTTARAALNPARVMVFITDGENNRPTKWTDSDYPNTYLKQYTTELKGTYGATALAVAVGVSTSRTEFTIIASKSSYIFGVTGYDQLNSILNSLVTATCTEFPEEPCGSSCKGFCSCSTTCVCPSQCASTNKCTPQTCTTGKYWSGCQNSTLDCADTNACTVDSCLTSTGECHNENVNATTYCDDGEPCTDDYCDSTTGCYHSTHTCTTTDKCKTASCVSGKGCVYTNVTCDDGKSCTVDTCDSSSGCIYTVSCDDNNKCTNDYCATNGTCAHSDVTCTTTDLCKVPTCDKTLGCRTTTKDCEDGNVCTDNTCYPLTGCSNTSIDNCDDQVCATANCTARHNCETVRCVFDSVTQAASCVYTNKTASGGVCNSGSKCIVDSCDLTDGTCSSVSLTDKCAAANTNKCAVGSCDSSNGTCITTPVTCSAVDVCHVATCDSSTGKCVQSSYCPAAPACFDMACVILADGNPYCNKTARVCESGSKCILSTCNNETDACENSAIPQPDDGINCTDAYCDPAVGWTQIATTKCNDNDPCTVDICNASTTDRCEYQSYCNDGKYCTSDVCSADSSGNAVCTHPAITCDLNLSSSEKNCYKAVCSETQHCYKQIIRGAFTNPCGSCMTSYATSSEKNDVTCIGSLAWPQAAAAIAAGAIAGIVIAAVIGFGAFSAASAFGTWKLIQMSKAGKGLAAHNNPMYKPSDNESINPAYAQR